MRSALLRWRSGLKGLYPTLRLIDCQRKGNEASMTSQAAGLVSLEMIRTLIEMPTVSRDSNLALIEHIKDYLEALGVETHLFHSDDRRKASLYATIGPKDRPGIMLAGHTDVVPVDGQEWTVDHWRLTERDGKLLGRGVCDMKG